MRSNTNQKSRTYCTCFKITVLSIIALCCSFNVFAQRVDTSKAEKKLLKEGYLNMSEGLLDSALVNYTQAYDLDKVNTNIPYNLGLLYLQQIVKCKAQDYLDRAVTDINPKWDPTNPYEHGASRLAYYYLARAQHINYHFDQAIETFTKFRKFIKEKDARQKDVDYWIACCNNGKTLMQNPVDCKIENAGALMNNVKSDYAPTLTADGQELFFTSNKTNVENGHNDAIWMRTRGSIHGEWSDSKDLGFPFNIAGGNDATVSVAPDGQSILLYESSDANNSTLYISALNGNTWSTPGKIDSASPGVVNAIGSNSVSSCLSPDGKTLYFASNRAGGMGGLDLYKSDMQSNGSWGSAVNLGNSINTSYDEDCPFVSFDGSLLFFSSTGHNTMGGYDVFMSQQNADGTWGNPQNLGYPVNTPDDDKYFTLSLDGKEAYYNTIRCKEQIGEMDIYKITFNKPLPVKPMGLFAGCIKTKDGGPLPKDIRINATSPDGKIVSVRPNSATGKFSIPLLLNQKYDFTVITGGNTIWNHSYSVPSDSSFAILGRGFAPGKCIVVNDTTNIFIVPKPPPPPPPPAPPSLNKPTFSKSFAYNMNAISDNESDIVSFENGIKKLLDSNKMVTINIEASASKVPTTKYGSNEVLSRIRAEALEKVLNKKYGMKHKNITIVLKHSVQGPEYANDAENTAKYAPFQYTKATVEYK